MSNVATQDSPLQRKEFLRINKKSYSWVSNTRGGSNKRVGWNLSSNLISGEAQITAGRVENFSLV